MEASSSNPPNLVYDVFINFRGIDVRKKLLGHLRQALDNYGLIKYFVDSKELKIGNRLDKKLERSIEESRTAIVILSQNYATSKWCLRELAKIMESMDEGKTDRVLPIYYHVDPHDVRHLSGSFKKSFDEYDEDKECTKEEVQGWRNAMTKVGYLVGEVINDDGDEAESCKKVTTRIFKELRRSMLVSPIKLNYLVDIPNRLSDIKKLLALESNDKRFIGIVGTCGIGKTTLAQVLFEDIASTFDQKSCYLTIPNRVENDHTSHLIKVQRLLLSRLLKMEIKTDILAEKSEGANLIKDCLKDIKVLIILDGVSEKEELEHLAGEYSWFGPGSRIIFTTKNKDVFPHPNPQVKVQLYNVEPLDYNNSFSLFWKHAFDQQSGGPNEQQFIQLSKDIVEKVEGNPQALEQIGSFLHGQSIDVWKEELESLVLVDNERLFKKLKVSYVQLESTESQQAFLDLACFFNEKSKRRIIEIFRSLKYPPLKVLNLLRDRYLIEIKKEDTIYVPNLMQEMGREIERKESQRNRIWLRKDAFDIFPQQHRVQYIHGIVLDNREKQPGLELKPKQLAEMNNLKILEIDNVRLVPTNQDDLSNQLRLIKWHGYPSNSLPLNFEAPYLFELLLPHAQTTYLWKGEKNFENLKVIDVSDSRNLVETPNFNKVSKLERLILNNCTRLKRIDKSITRLKHLRLVDLTGCFSLETSSLECIETLKKNLPNIEICGFGIERCQSSLEGVARQSQPPKRTPKSRSFTSYIKERIKFRSKK